MGIRGSDVGPVDEMDFDRIPFMQARWYTQTNGRTVNKIVLHSMEAPEKGDTAEAIARYFATTDRKASAHYCLDNNSVVQTCQTRDVAYCAPGANHDGVHLELAGYARQTREQWEDAYSAAMLEIAAELCAKVLVPKFNIPVLYLSAEMMKRTPSIRGFTTHNEVSKAFRRSSHWDPGPGFPMWGFLEMVRAKKG